MMTRIDFGQRDQTRALEIALAGELGMAAAESRLGRADLYRQFKSPVPAVLEDLLDVAMALYVADRLVRRSPGKEIDPQGQAQGREFSLVLPVREVGRWQNPELQQALVLAIEAYTGDGWSFEFTQRAFMDTPEQGMFAIDRPEHPFVGLFSGGLDSLAGAVNQLLDPKFDTGIFAVATSNSRLAATQLLTLSSLSAIVPGKSILPVRFDHDFNPITSESVNEHNQEKSQRARGFLFAALGAVVTQMAGVNALHVYENGVGAINLGYTGASLGLDHTRAMNPFAIERMQTFISTLLGRDFQIVNRSLWKTKGEMCLELKRAGFADLAAQTMSCDGFSAVRATPVQCGRCTSCLLRRVSLYHAGISDSGNQYRIDLAAQTLLPSEDRFIGLRGMLSQVETLKRALAQPHGLMRAFPDLRAVRNAIVRLEGRPVHEVDTELVRMYTAYVSEWTAFRSSFTAFRSDPNPSLGTASTVAV
jgi:7-cyano-7-deazaguanine synthase in queuosine biosynthesis